MERAHRIGQTKPVRVYRLVCRGSVEERMVSRAEKKLFLNAMVAEADPDEQLHESGSSEEQSEDAKRQAEISEALGIGGTSISKGELASLIRFGANAVVEGSMEHEQGIAGNQISDEDLDALLEMQGRDIPRASKVTTDIKNDNNSSNSNNNTTSSGVNLLNSTSNTELDELAKAQQALRDRMQMLKEVDLRQLGNTIYDKKKRKSTGKTEGVAMELDNAGNIPGVLDSKRVRKERVVMMDGRGTGYGGSVPVLAETIEKETPVETGDGLKFRTRGRIWSHHTFCCMCGKNAEIPTPPVVVETVEEIKKSKTGKMSRNPSTVELAAVTDVPVNAPVKCAHCPFIFHLECCNGPPPPAPVDTAPGKGYRKKAPPVLSRPSGMFICPHHRCVSCNRSTASAGGLLFRCTGCMTAYCEDCLPQDEIESIGRCRPLEKLGYDSKQSYFIRCPYCCHLDGFKPLGILNDNEEANAQAAKLQAETAAVTSTEQTTLPRDPIKTSLKTSRSALSLSSEKEISDADVGEDEIPDPTEAQEEEMEGAEEPIVPLKTQLMRLQWTEIFPTPVPSPVKKTPKSKAKKGKKTSKAKSSSTTTSATSGKRKLEVSDAEDSSSDQDEEEQEDQLSEAAAIWREWSPNQPSSSTTLTENTPAALAMQQLVTHPLWTGLQKVRSVVNVDNQKTNGLTLSELCDSDLLLFSHVLNKIEAGKNIYIYIYIILVCMI